MMSERAVPATTLTTAADALHDEEVERTRAFLRTGWIVALGVLAIVAILPGDRQLGLALAIAVAAGLAFSVWIHAQLRDPTRYNPHKLSAVALVCVVCGLLGILYVGYFSAAPIIVVLGLYFFCRTENVGVAIVIFVVSSGAHLVEAILIITGVIADPGFYPIPKHVSIQAQIAGHGIVQAGYLLGFVMARIGRTTSLRAIDQLQTATDLAARREAQVNELRQDLDRALKIGGPGRFTGHLVGAWQLDTVIGRGAMGEVYEATHVTTGATAAIKLLRRELLGDRNHVERFLREVRIASALDSPHVVRVVDASTAEDAIPFLAMERLRGQTLGDLLRTTSILPRVQLGELVEQVGMLLEVARVAGVVHRDIKPHNLFLTDDRVWKVLDFGVALAGESGTLTQGAVVGTPTYMAPEQARGAPADHRCDVSALAAVMYRCITGRVPFAARDAPTLLYSVVHRMPQRPRAFADVDAQLEAVLALGLAKSRSARLQTAAELVAAYTAAARGSLDDALVQRAHAILRKKPWEESDDLPTRELPPGPLVQ
jgi:eukaryotic-like serine/threonine-protein kinase